MMANTQLDDGKFSVFIDLEKGFGIVDHNILLKKIDYQGARGIANEWLETKKKNRKHLFQLVVIYQVLR